jgi:hypothetical protein
MIPARTAAEAADMRGGFGFPIEEGGPWGKHGLPHGASAPAPREAS